MTDTQLDPEMELEAQQLACYEDEMRELAAEVAAQDEDFEANKDFYEEAMKHIDEETAADVEFYEAMNKWWVLLVWQPYTFEMFRPGTPYKSKNEDGEDDWFSIVNCLEYGNWDKPLYIRLNEYSWGWVSLIIDVKKWWYNVNINKHDHDTFEEALVSLNDMVPFISKIME